MAKVSVIVPNYNHSKYLRERLDSIFNQTYQDFEVILLDDVSSDNSVAILEKHCQHPKVSHLIVNEQNSGNTFKQWNRGVKLAKGEFIWIAESDDFCEPNFLELVIEPLLTNNRVSISYSQSYRVNKKSEIVGNWLSQTKGFKSNDFESNFISEGNLFIEKYLIFKNVIPNASAVVFRKDVFLNTSEQDIFSELKYCGDWLIYLKMLVNRKVSFISKPLNSFRYHDKSVIAKANKIEHRISIIDIDFEMRKQMIDFLRIQNSKNLRKIIKTNNLIIRETRYEKARLLIGDKQFFNGFLMLLSVFDVFIKKYNFKKKIKSIFYN